MKKISAYFQLVRLDHAVAFVVATIIGFILANAKLQASLLLIPFLLEIAAFSLNDLVDYKVDKKNKRRDRPLVTGKVKKVEAFFIWFFSSLLFLLFSFSLSRTLFIFSVAILFLSFLYDVWLKRVVLIGNMYVAFTMALPFLFPYIVENTPLTSYSLAAILLAFLFGMSREIVKDIQDMKNERGTLPCIVGKELSFIVSLFFSALALSVSIIFFLLSPLFRFPVFLTSLLFVLENIRVIKTRKYNEYRKRTFFLSALGVVFILLSLILETRIG